MNVARQRPPPLEVVLVHGAGGGSWEWVLWERELAAAGMRPRPIELMPVQQGYEVRLKSKPIGFVRKRIERRQSTRATIYMCYRYRSHACSSHTRVYVCLDDCALCDDAGVCVSVWGVVTVGVRLK